MVGSFGAGLGSGGVGITGSTGGGGGIAPFGAVWQPVTTTMSNAPNRPAQARKRGARFIAGILGSPPDFARLEADFHSTAAYAINYCVVLKYMKPS
jgi:hypothetical protein